MCVHTLLGFEDPNYYSRVAFARKGDLSLQFQSFSQMNEK
jgi:hypothetical protein